MRPGTMTQRTTPTYFVAEAFETFPQSTSLANIEERIVALLLPQRHTLMQSLSIGLTEVYNRFHDPDETAEDIQKLRELHVEMDNAVAAAYGWTDLDLGHGFHETKQGLRFTISEPARREVLARLLKLNHERYAEEVSQGLAREGQEGQRQRRGDRKSRRQMAQASSIEISRREEQARD